MLGFTDTISNIVQALRATELNLSGRFRRLLCVRIFAGKKQVFLLLVAEAL